MGCLMWTRCARRWIGIIDIFRARWSGRGERVILVLVLDEGVWEESLCERVGMRGMMCVCIGWGGRRC